MKEKEPIVISQIYTSCKDCIFASYNNNEQDGCKLNKLKDYENAGIKIIEVEDKGKVFSLIDGRFCLFFRTEEIMNTYPSSSWKDLVILQTKIPYHILLLVEKEDSFATIKAAMKKLKEQEILPNLVTVINKQHPHYLENPKDYIKPSTLLEILKNSGFHKYSLRNVYDTTLSDRELIDLVFDNSNQYPFPFYAVFRASFDIPLSFSKSLNDAILIKMLQLGFVKPIDDINGMIVNRTAHKKHGGNCFGVSLEDKILKYEEGGDRFIFSITDVCPDID